MKISIITPTIRPEGLKVLQESLKYSLIKDFEWLVDVGLGTTPDFNKAMNRMLKRSKGELIVFIQDYIKVPPHGLFKFWHLYRKEPKTFFTAPVGKTTDWEHIDWDWRKHREYTETVNFMEWEIDWAAAPRAALFEIGGFDEYLDQAWGFDNVNVAMRALDAGYKFKNVQHNMAIAYDHDKTIKHPFRVFRNENLHNSRLDQFRMGLKINYLN